MTKRVNTVHKDSDLSTSSSPPLQELSNQFWQQSQQAMEKFWSYQQEHMPLWIAGANSAQQAIQNFMTQSFADPSKLTEAQLEYWQAWSALWQETIDRYTGKAENSKQVPSPFIQANTDRRFTDPDWEQQPLFHFVKQAYLLTAQHIQHWIEQLQGMDAKESRKVHFYLRQWLNAIAPSNFIATNPEVLRKTLETKGENLWKGWQNFLADMAASQGNFRIKMTDMQAFEVGKNLAVTPGKVIYQNDLMQLIQYSPATKQVYQRPLLIVPPWINKYYILDLQEHNSLVRWLVNQGYSVFLISWINPDEHHASKSFDDYMLAGPLAALDQITKATGSDEVNALGFCIGGTLLACTLAYMAAKRDRRITSATYLATLLDFSDPGELGVFIDEQQISALEERMAQQGYLDGGDMALTFSLLRSNDLIWSYYVNNYLRGEEPFPFDILFWNADSTNMPAKMHSFYLRQMYLNNQLREPKGVTLAGVALDLRKITTPAYFLATEQDHIAPWTSCYAGAQLQQGAVRFVLAGSGHVAGVINPPAKSKYGYKVYDKLPDDPQAWLEHAQSHQQSWWEDWQQWLAKLSGKLVPARQPKKALEDAPGSYVKVRLAPID